jgi:hypothetical protein
LKKIGRAIPDTEDGNPFMSIAQLMSVSVSIATLATAIEEDGIYTWDRFGRFGKAAETDVANALTLLEAQYKWANDPEVDSRNDPRSPMEQCEGDWDNPFDRYGWAAEVAPDFDNIRHSQFEEEPRKVAKVKRKAPDAFVGRFVRLLVEIVKRDPTINIDEMPGTKSDLLAVASKFDDRLDHPLTTFDSYIEGLCVVNTI